MIFDVQIVPVDSDFRQTVTLDARQFVLDVSWSHRSESWYVSVYALASGQTLVPIVEGQRLSIGWPVLAGCVGTDRPPGELLLIDLTGSGTDATREDLGTRTKLYYYDADEMGR